MSDLPDNKILGPDDLIQHIKDNLRAELYTSQETARDEDGKLLRHIVVRDRIKLYFGDELISEG